jgi:hypothetical protein
MKSLARRSYNLPLIVLMIVVVFLAWQGSARAGGLRYYQYRGYTSPVQNSIIVGGTTAVVFGASFAPAPSYGCCGGCNGGTAATLVQQNYVPVLRTFVPQQYIPVQTQQILSQNQYVPVRVQQLVIPRQVPVRHQSPPEAEDTPTRTPANDYTAGCTTESCPAPGADFSPGYTPVASTGHGVFRQRTMQRNRY